jgi:hypothetical protein
MWNGCEGMSSGGDGLVRHVMDCGCYDVTTSQGRQNDQPPTATAVLATGDEEGHTLSTNWDVSQ